MIKQMIWRLNFCTSALFAFTAFMTVGTGPMASAVAYGVASALFFIYAVLGKLDSTEDGD